MFTYYFLYIYICRLKKKKNNIRDARVLVRRRIFHIMYNIRPCCSVFYFLYLPLLTHV